MIRPLSWLNGRHDRAIELRLRGWTAREIAGDIRLGPRTVQRWLVDPVFVAALAERQAEERERTGYLLGGLVQEAVSALQRAMGSGDMPAAVAAARTVLDRAGFRPAERTESVGDHRLQIEIHYTNDWSPATEPTAEPPALPPGDPP